MTTPSPEHIDALGKVIRCHIGGADNPADPHGWRCYDKERYPGDCECSADLAEDILASPDPAVHAAMLDTLTRHGVLKGDFRNLRPCGCRAGMPALMCCDDDAPTTMRLRHVTEWREVTP